MLVFIQIVAVITKDGLIVSRSMVENSCSFLLMSEWCELYLVVTLLDDYDGLVSRCSHQKQISKNWLVMPVLLLFIDIFPILQMNIWEKCSVVLIRNFKNLHYDEYHIDLACFLFELGKGLRAQS